MPTRPCPDCGQPAPRHLPDTSAKSVANFYRCDKCGHVFSVSKDNPDAPSRHVTPPRGREGNSGGNSATS